MLDAGGCRRLAAAALLKAALDAHAGDELALEWLDSELAHSWADELGLGKLWPPGPARLLGFADLRRQARALERELVPEPE